MNLELYIVDNNSTDGSREELNQKIGEWEKLNLFPIEYIENSENIGFGRSHNQVLRSAHGELFLLLNSDAILSPDCIEKAIPKFTDPSVGAVQCKVLRYDFKDHKPTKVIDVVGIKMLKSRRTICEGQGEIDNGQFEHEKEVFGPDGSVPIYSKLALESIKLVTVEGSQGNVDSEHEYFDEDFFLYKEDIDLAWRLRLAGWKTFYVPTAVAYHGRGSGESKSKKYSEIIKERKNISLFSKKLSFKHQRFMQIKNESLNLLFLHFPQFIFKEIGTWGYVFLVEGFAFEMLKDLARKIPLFLRKRKLVMETKTVADKELKRWFE